MTKFIAVCDATGRSRFDRFAGLFVDQLEKHFGSVKSFERRPMRQIKYQRSKTANMLTYSIVLLYIDDLSGKEVGLVKVGHLSGNNFAAFVNSRTVFDLPCALKENDSCLGGFNEFLIFNTDIQDAFFEEVRLLPLSDIRLDLDNYLSLGIFFIEFMHADPERIEGSRVGGVVYSENHAAQALDIYCQFKNFVSSSNLKGMLFIGHLPKYKKYINNNIPEMIGLQNIALSLINLNYRLIPNNILSEMFKGSLH